MSKTVSSDNELDLKKANRKFCRKFAALIISEMAKSDTSLEEIAFKTNRPYPEIKKKLDKLINGVSFKYSLDFISDVFLSMGGEIVWKVDRPTPSETPLESQL